MANPFTLFPHADISDNLFLLKYATGILTLSNDRRSFICKALETCADFGRSDNVAFFNLDNGKLNVEYHYQRGRYSEPNILIPDQGIIFSILREKNIEIYDISSKFPFPFPLETNEIMLKQCLCVPVMNKNQEVLGLITLEIHLPSLTLDDLQTLFVFGGIFGISIDNMNYFIMAITDGLTGVFARRFFDISISQELARLRRKAGCFSIMLMDLDYFKDVNDTLGHQAGDRVIRFAAGILKKNLRQGVDIICRYGGDEFVVIMPDTTEIQAGRVAERIREEYCQARIPDVPSSQKKSLTAGVLEIRSSLDILEKDIFSRVDGLLYAGKKGGRNRVVLESQQNPHLRS